MDRLLENVKDRAGSYSQRQHSDDPTIFRVRREVRRRNRYAYEPKALIIGPYHRGKCKDFQATEDLKWRLLGDYLSNVPNGSNNEGLRNMKDMEMRARACYSEEINMDSERFVKMLLLDGCFLVQIFKTFSSQDKSLQEGAAELFRNTWLLPDVIADLLLLENQIPYFIVKHLLDTLPKTGWNSFRLQNTAIRLFANALPQYQDIPEPNLPDEGFQVYHLLHLLHKWILSIPKSGGKSDTRSCNRLPLKPLCSALSWTTKKAGDCLSMVLPCCSNSLLSESCPSTIPTMTELEEAGVKIKVKKANRFLDISFSVEKGVLEIPAIQIGGLTNVFFANLIAFEQTWPGRGSHFTTYAGFLDDIINTPRDVGLLYQEGIIQRWLADDKGIASVINNLTPGAALDYETCYLGDLYKDLNAYCQSRWPRWRAKAVHGYFNNPWTIISFIAGVMLLVASVLQATYSILDYDKP